MSTDNTDSKFDHVAASAPYRLENALKELVLLRSEVEYLDEELALRDEKIQKLVKKNLYLQADVNNLRQEIQSKLLGQIAISVGSTVLMVAVFVLFEK